MPAFLIVRLYRIVPLLVILAVIAILIYLVVSWRHTPAKAKEILIRCFIVLNTALSAFFALATLYAWLENNSFVMDFFITLLGTTVVMLGITYLCRWKFLKNNPHYRWRPTGRATKGPRKKGR